MDDPTLPLPGLSPVSGKRLDVRFDGGLLSSDGGILLLREVEQRLGVADRMAACIKDPRAPDLITHSLTDIIRFRLMMIAAGYEDGNDASSLRVDPMFKLALDLAPSDRALCSQPTISRLENLPDTRALLGMGRAMVDLYCDSFRTVPKRIVLDIDDTFDAVHGGQQLRLFNAHHDEYGFQPIVVFDGEGRFITAVLRPAKRPGGKEIRAFLRRLMRAIRANWPRTQIMLRGDSHYCCPGSSTGAGRADTTSSWASRRPRHCAAMSPISKPAPKRASRPQPTMARCAASRHSTTALKAGAASSGSSPASKSAIRGRHPLRRHQSQRARPLALRAGLLPAGQAENHIKSWKTHLAADRTSCTKATANQLRLFLHAGAYWLMWGLRTAMPKRSIWRTVQFDTLRLHLIKIAARVVEMKTLIRVQWPTACPNQQIVRVALDRIPRLVT